MKQIAFAFTTGQSAGLRMSDGIHPSFIAAVRARVDDSSAVWTDNNSIAVPKDKAGALHVLARKWNYEVVTTA